MPTPEHKQLISSLNKMIKQEHWQKMPKRSGTLTNITLTKNGNLKVMLQTPRGDFIFYILKRNKNLFAQFQLHKTTGHISIAARRSLGKYYCTKITTNPQTTPSSLPEKSPSASL